MFALVSYYYFRFWSMCTSSLRLTLISEVGRCQFDCSHVVDGPLQNNSVLPTPAVSDAS